MQPPIPLIFQKRLFILLTLSFIVATVIGTVTHECGHYFVAKSYGYKASIHYKYTNSQPQGALLDTLLSIWHRDSVAIKSNEPFSKETQYKSIQRKIFRQQVNISLAGPLQTMLTGTIGLLLLIAFRKKYQQSDTLKGWQWLLIFITLFWLRELFNLVAALVYCVVYHRWLYGDESSLSIAWHLPLYTAHIITGSIAAIILSIVVFKFVPIWQRFTFLLAGLVGGGLGAVLWLHLLGPVIMP